MVISFIVTEFTQISFILVKIFLQKFYLVNYKHEIFFLQYLAIIHV